MIESTGFVWPLVILDAEWSKSTSQFGDRSFIGYQINAVMNWRHEDNLHSHLRQSKWLNLTIPGRIVVSELACSEWLASDRAYNLYGSF